MSTQPTLGRILLVDADVDQLASLGAALRARGFTVVLANGAAMASQRLASASFDVMLVAAALLDRRTDGLTILDALAARVSKLPPHVLLVSHPTDSASSLFVYRGDIDQIAARVLFIASTGGGEPDSVPLSEQVGSLAQAPLLDVVEWLFGSKSTGLLRVTTSRGAGELRLSGGELVDAVYVRLEGHKALLRLLAETEGDYVFTPGAPAAMRRITTATAEILQEAAKHLEDIKRLRTSLGAGAAIVATESGDSVELSALARSLLSRLRTPSTLDELLDTSPEPDVSLLEALAELDAAGRLKRVEEAARRQPFVPTEQLDTVRALAARARAHGFTGPARVVVAAAATRVSVFAHAALRLQEAVPPAQPTPTVPLPHEIATLRISDGVEVEILSLPLVPAYSPLWHMALAGAAAVIRLDDAAAELLRDACEAADLPLLDAHALVSKLDETDAAQVGTLLRAALEAAIC